MSLIQYRLKRNFDKTKEPEPKKEIESKSRFVIQKHNASHLHYDFRLEIKDEENGEVVLKSWAVPKNVPEKSGVKHLAIQTEDHPVSYIDFEGTIPEDNYGAGDVEIWDKGKWGLMSGEFKDNAVKFNLWGERIKGRYVLAKMKNLKDGDKKKNYWLIYKKEEDIL